MSTPESASSPNSEFRELFAFARDLVLRSPRGTSAQTDDEPLSNSVTFDIQGGTRKVTARLTPEGGEAFPVPLNPRLYHMARLIGEVGIRTELQNGYTHSSFSTLTNEGEVWQHSTTWRGTRISDEVDSHKLTEPDIRTVLDECYGN